MTTVDLTHSALRVGRLRNGSELKEHRKGFGAIPDLPRQSVEPDEPEPLVKRHGVGLRIDDNTDTAQLVGHAVREDQHAA